jgi:hypothetical protein
MNGEAALDSPVLDRIQQWAIIAAIAGVVLSLIGALFYGAEFLQSYLFAYLFWLGIALGSLAIVMLHNVTGGGWGVVIRQLLLSAARTLPVMAILFIPLLLGLRGTYAWASPDAVNHDAILRHKQPYLNIGFFVLRVAIYFAVWIALAWLVNAWLTRQNRDATPRRALMIRRYSGLGLLLYGLTISFASIDWVMSLEEHWFSTIIGMLFMVGQSLSTIAFAIVMVALLHARRPMSDVVTRGHFNDLGNLLLTFVILWAYVAFSQYLIIWAGNIPEESDWYIHRNTGALRFISFALVVLHFAIPFLLLLGRNIKQQIEVLATVAAAILVMRVIDLFWMVTPSFRRPGFFIRWTDLAAPLAIGGIWLAVFVWQLRGRPMLLGASLEPEGHGHG